MFAKGEGFGDVFRCNLVGRVKIGDGLGDFHDLKIAAGGELEFVGGGLEKLMGGRGEFEMLINLQR